MGFPGGASGKEPACQCKRCQRPRFSPWVRKIPWTRAWQTTPVFYSPHFFLWLYAKYIYLVLTLTPPIPLKLRIGKKAAEPPDCQTQLLGYWHQFMTVFEEDNTRGRNQDPITFVFHHWPLPHISPWTPHGGRAQFLKLELTVFPSPLVENKSHLSISSKLCLCIFLLASVGWEGQDFGWQHWLMSASPITLSACLFDSSSVVDVF